MVAKLGGSLNSTARYEEIIDGIEGDGKEYVLREATAGDAIAYRERTLQGLNFSAEGKIVSPKTTGTSAEILLISLCVVRRNSDGKEERLKEEEIKRWTNRTQKALFEQIRLVSLLNEGDPAEKTALKYVLSQPDSPISFSALVEFVDKFQKDEKAFAIVRMLADIEEETKNS